MTTFRFSIEFGTDDDQISVNEAMAHVEALREWLTHYPIRKFGTLFVGEIETNPVAVRLGHPVIVTQGGFEVNSAENVAEALYAVWGYKPRIDQIQPASGGVWLVPIPLTVFESNRFVWLADPGIRVLVSA